MNDSLKPQTQLEVPRSTNVRATHFTRPNIPYSKGMVVQGRNDEDDWERKGPKGRKARRWMLFEWLTLPFTFLFRP